MTSTRWVGLASLSWLAASAVGCSGGGGGGGPADAAPDGIRDAADGAASEAGGSDGGSTNDGGSSQTCGASDNPSGDCGGCNPPYSYQALETTKCECGSGIGGANPPGSGCQQAQGCTPVCCACPNGKGHFAAAVCTGGVCANQDSACTIVLGDSFAAMSLCK